MCLSRQSMSFVATKVCFLQQNFCRNKKKNCDKKLDVTSLLRSWQTRVCHDKTSFVVTKVYLSWQNFCCDKYVFAATNICWDKSFVATKIFCPDKQFCHGKHTFVMTKDMFCRDKHVSQKWYLFRACRTAFLKVPFKHCSRGNMGSGVWGLLHCFAWGPL